jgi:hypothetical protein
LICELLSASAHPARRVRSTERNRVPAASQAASFKETDDMTRMNDDLRGELLVIVLEEAFGYQEHVARAILTRPGSSNAEHLETANNIVNRFEATVVPRIVRGVPLS